MVIRNVPPDLHDFSEIIDRDLAKRSATFLNTQGWILEGPAVGLLVGLLQEATSQPFLLYWKAGTSIVLSIPSCNLVPATLVVMRTFALLAFFRIVSMTWSAMGLSSLWKGGLLNANWAVYVATMFTLPRRLIYLYSIISWTSARLSSQTGAYDRVYFLCLPDLLRSNYSNVPPPIISLTCFHAFCPFHSLWLLQSEKNDALCKASK